MQHRFNGFAEGGLSGEPLQWTPRVYQAGEIRCNILRAMYTQVGDWVTFSYSLQTTQAGTAGATLLVSMPTQMPRNYPGSAGEHPLGTGVVVRPATAAYSVTIATADSNFGLPGDYWTYFRSANGTGAGVTLGAEVNFAMPSGGYISGSGSYLINQRSTNTW